MNRVTDQLIKILATEAAQCGQIITTVKTFLKTAKDASRSQEEVDKVLARLAREVSLEYGMPEDVVDSPQTAKLLAHAAVKHGTVIGTFLAYAQGVAETHKQPEKILANIGVEIMNGLAYGTWARNQEEAE